MKINSKFASHIYFQYGYVLLISYLLISKIYYRFFSKPKMKSGWHECKENKFYQVIRTTIIGEEKMKYNKIKIGSLNNSVDEKDDIYPLN